MKRLLIKVIKGEKGQALPVVLVLMLIGGLLIAPSLSYATTSLNVGQIVEKKVNGLYAADAGVEYVLWWLEDGRDIPWRWWWGTELPENVNQMEVKIRVHGGWWQHEYALYFGDLIEVTEQHYDWLDVDGEMDPEPIEEETYKYTITVTWQPYPGTPNINLEEVGVRLPIGYEYKPGSAASFLGDELFSTDDPYVEEQDQAGAYMYKWGFDTTVEQDDPIATQTFYVTGDGEQEGDYTWVVGAHGQHIGEVGEVIGTLYRIMATATQDGETTATVMADALVKETETEVEIRVILWQINPPWEWWWWW